MTKNTEEQSCEHNEERVRVQGLTNKDLVHELRIPLTSENQATFHYLITEVLARLLLRDV